MTEERAAAMANDVLASYPDPTLWSGANGEVLFVAKSDYQRVLEADLLGHPPVMVPAVNEAGEIRGYMALSTGIIPKDVAESPGFDLAEEVRTMDERAQRINEGLDRTGAAGH